jgi:hypothetical protein
MTAQVCQPQIKVCAIRVALLATDGKPAGGASSMYVSKALATATLSPQYDDGTETSEKNACGEVLLSDKTEPSFLRADISLDFLNTDPYLLSILQPQSDLLTGAWGEGWAMPPIGALSGQASLELWATKVNDGTTDLDYPYAWWAFPLVKNLKMGDKEYSANAQHTILTGQCYENSNWFDGPNNDWPTSSDRCAQWIPATTLPTIDCTFDNVVAS